MRGRSARVHHPLGNAFVVEMRDLFTQDEILQQGRAAIACFEGVLIVVDAETLIGGEKLVGRILSIFFRSAILSLSSSFRLAI